MTDDELNAIIDRLKERSGHYYALRIEAAAAIASLREERDDARKIRDEHFREIERARGIIAELRERAEKWEASCAEQQRITLRSQEELRTMRLRAEKAERERNELIHDVERMTKAASSEATYAEALRAQRESKERQYAERAEAALKAGEAVAWTFRRSHGSGLSFVRPHDYHDEDGNLVQATPLFTSPAAPGWQPIETAPKDGTHILACLPDSDTCYVLEWADAEKGIRREAGPGVGWHLAWDGWFFPEYSQPTHWQPLPALPTEKEPTK